MRSLHSFPISSPHVFVIPLNVICYFFLLRNDVKHFFYPNLIDTASVFSEVKLVHQLFDNVFHAEPFADVRMEHVLLRAISQGVEAEGVAVTHTITI